MSRLDDFLKKAGVHYLSELEGSKDHLPCFLNRYRINDRMPATYAFMDEYVELIGESTDITLLVFSVTENDYGHARWVSWAKKRGHVVVEGDSIHGRYKCWMLVARNPHPLPMRYR